ncbi:hypothetical protein NEOLEDRAFT_1026039, partial [Neolentinus lepideus HHB14362 ss-1]
LPRPHAAIIMQLHTGHTPLNAHLHRIRASPSPNCEHCPGVPEDVHHYILECGMYEQQRFTLRCKLGRTASNISALLTSEVKSLLTYVHQTKRFTQTHGE